MRPRSLRLALALTLFLAFCQPVLGLAGEWAVYFSPRGGCTGAIVKAVDNARSSLLIQAYSFSSHDITKAVVDAHARGVAVKAILDKSQLTEKYSTLKSLALAGIPTWIDKAHNIAHNKIMIIDGETVITGSFNFTKNAEESNAENLLVIRDNEVASRYQENWEKHLQHSKAYQSPEAPGGNP